ncbi:hypothetical protein GCM10023082_63990 [Streptomyces tremellae]|uniref:Phospholipase C n=1 Tax=Streptomyces tremellae TaxID=1124239 RepID=A0ABP7GDT4_9ACTN
MAGVIDAIAANPDVWAKTVFILSYDENDGMFDHGAPPTPPAGTPDAFVTKTSPTGVDGAGLPVGLGFRVSAIVVSPWTAGGWVCSELFDHTSQLRFPEEVTGVREPNISAWRRRKAGDLTSAFRFGDGTRKAPLLPGTNGQYNLSRYQGSRLPCRNRPRRASASPGRSRAGARTSPDARPRGPAAPPRPGTPAAPPRPGDPASGRGVAGRGQDPGDRAAGRAGPGTRRPPIRSS